MKRDRYLFKKEISQVRNILSSGGAGGRVEKRIQDLERHIKISIQTKKSRIANLPDLNYNMELPITRKTDEIVEAVRRNQVVIISGETGSGKTTQIPRFCLAAGRGIEGRIACTQPRRIAAITVSNRIAEEMGEELGRSVGYKIRFQDRTGDDCYIKIMTDGILLAEAHRDPYLLEYDTIIVDEAHERNLNIDFVLGIVKRLLNRRKDLKLIITSATIDTEKFSRAFNDAPVVEVSGRMFPVDVRYSHDSDTTEAGIYVERAVQELEKIIKNDPWGDILIFMPTEESILETCNIIERHKSLTVLPLFARLSASDQKRVFADLPGRKAVVATNIAETSITIPAIKYVIDTGLARIPRYSPRSRITSLPVVAVSKSSADQRKGRCGRVRDGICIRLYSEEDYSSRVLYTPPEILRANLAEVILRMLALNIGDPSTFPFIDPPDKKSINDGFDSLLELGAIKRVNERGKKRSYTLTGRGRMMAELPLDPRLSRMLIEAGKEGCLEEILVLVSALSIQNPRERPAEKAQLADQKQAVFKDPYSDFITLLNLWNSYLKSTNGGRSLGLVRKFCTEHYLSFKRMREWQDILHQIRSTLTDSRLGIANAEPRGKGYKNEKYTAKYAAIHRSILAGYLHNIAIKKEKNIYRGTKGRELMIFPGSVLFNKADTWIVAAEMVKTTRLYARIAANIESEWIEDIAGELCRYSHSRPFWDRGKETVMALEQVSLFGLPIISQRPVPYGPVNPEEAAEIFIRHGLVREEMTASFPFMEHNRLLMENVRKMEDKLRRKGILVAEENMLAFYQGRLQNISDTSALQTLINHRKGDDFLKMSMDDLFAALPGEEELSLFPDHIDIGERSFPCEYAFEPGAENDGLTLLLPANIASLVPTKSMDWLVPGLYREKVRTLIKGLPKEHRRKLVPLTEKIDTVVREMPQGKEALFTALSRFVHDRFGVLIQPSVWSEIKLPNYLEMRISLRSPEGKELYAGRGPLQLLKGYRPEIGPDRLEKAKKNWEKIGISLWDFGDLPETVFVDTEGGAGWPLSPALTEEEDGVALRLYQDSEKAHIEHRKGVAALYSIHFRNQLKSFQGELSLPGEIAKSVNYFGGESRFMKRFWNRIIRDLFSRNIRKKDAFIAYAEKTAVKIFRHADKMMQEIVLLLTVYSSARGTVYHLENQKGLGDKTRAFLAAMQDEIERLLPGDFLENYPVERFQDLRRYIKAADIRTQRGYVNPGKDDAKSRDVELYQRLWKKMLDSLKPSASQEKLRAVQNFQWMIEEFKVSTFAPELKTAVRISGKRMKDRLNEIEAML